jgi:SRSO17 transposase
VIPRAGDARRAAWDVDGVRDDVRGYVTEHLGDQAGVLIADETGFVNKGSRPKSK